MGQDSDIVCINVRPKSPNMFPSSLIYAEKMSSNIFCFILKSIILSPLSGELVDVIHHSSFHNKSRKGEEFEV